MFQTGQKIGQYELIKKLAKGGFGEVWLAEKQSPLVTKKVAVKLPHDEQVSIEAIRQEATLWEQASGHPNVLPIIDADIYDGQVVIVSEYAEDGSLADKLRAHGKLPVEEAARITVGILSGLEYLHSKNIIHRDIKPANILMQGSTPRLADFGISRAMQTDNVSLAIVGTHNYMSPEAFEGVRNVQTDVWSVGVVLYQLLTGLPPFPQKDPSEIMYAILMKPTEPLSAEIPPRLREIVYKALEKDQKPKENPPRRYQTAAAMREDLIGFLESYSQSFSAPSETVKDIAQTNIGQEIQTKVTIPVSGSRTDSNNLRQPTFGSKFSPIAVLAITLGFITVIWLAIYSFSQPSSSVAQSENAAANVSNSANNSFDEITAEKLNEAINYSKQGEAYYKGKQFDSAIAAYTKAIELNPNDFGVYNNRGIAYHSKREFEQAIDDYTKAVELNPNHFSGYNNRGAAYEDLKDYDRAVADFRKALELDPENEMARKNLEKVLNRR